MSSNVRETREWVRRFKTDLQELKPELKEVNELFTIYLALGDEAGLPKDLVGRLRGIQQMRIAIQSLETSWTMLQAGGVLGMFTGGGGLLLGGFMLMTGLMSLMQVRRPQY